MNSPQHKPLFYEYFKQYTSLYYDDRRVDSPFVDYAIPYIVSNNQNLIVSAPAGSGKSLIMELSILQSLRECLSGKKSISDFRVFYIASSLRKCKYKLAQFQERFSKKSINFSLSCSHIKFSELLQDKFPSSDNIVVSDPDSFNYFLRKHYRQLNENLDVLLIDEIYLLMSPEKKGVFECNLNYIKNQTKARIIVSSSLTPNIEDLEKWLNAVPVLSKSRIIPLSSREFYQCISQQKYAHLQTVKYFNMKVLHVLSKLEKQIKNATYLIFCVYWQSAGAVCSRLVSEMNQQQRKSIMSRDSYNKAQEDEIQEQIKKIKNEKLKTCVGARAAYYHEKMFEEDRQIVSMLVRKGWIVVTFTSSSFINEINFNAKVVIVMNLSLGDKKKYSYVQMQRMIERAGRPGIDKEGVYVLMGLWKQISKFTAHISQNTISTKIPKIQSHLMNNFIDFYLFDKYLNQDCDFIKYYQNSLYSTQVPFSEQERGKLAQEILKADNEFEEYQLTVARVPTKKYKAVFESRLSFASFQTLNDEEEISSQLQEIVFSLPEVHKYSFHQWQIPAVNFLLYQFFQRKQYPKISNDFNRLPSQQQEKLKAKILIGLLYFKKTQWFQKIIDRNQTHSETIEGLLNEAVDIWHEIKNIAFTYQRMKSDKQIVLINVTTLQIKAFICEINVDYDKLGSQVQKNQTLKVFVFSLSVQKNQWQDIDEINKIQERIVMTEINVDYDKLEQYVQENQTLKVFESSSSDYVQAPSIKDIQIQSFSNKQGQSKEDNLVSQQGYLGWELIISKNKFIQKQKDITTSLEVQYNEMFSKVQMLRQLCQKMRDSLRVQIINEWRRQKWGGKQFSPGYTIASIKIIEKTNISEQVSLANKLKIITAKVLQNQSTRFKFADNYIKRILENLQTVAFKATTVNHQLLEIKDKFKVINFKLLNLHRHHLSDHINIQTDNTVFYVSFYCERLLFFLDCPIEINPNILYCPVVLEPHNSKNGELCVTISKWYMEQLELFNAHWEDFSLYLIVKDQNSAKVKYYSKASVNKIGSSSIEELNVNLYLRKALVFVNLNLIFNWLKLVMPNVRNAQICNSVRIFIGQGLTCEITSVQPFHMQNVKQEPKLIRDMFNYFSPTKGKSQRTREEARENFILHLRLILKKLEVEIEEPDSYTGHFKYAYSKGKRISLA